MSEQKIKIGSVWHISDYPDCKVTVVYVGDGIVVIKWYEPKDNEHLADYCDIESFLQEYVEFKKPTDTKTAWEKVENPKGQENLNAENPVVNQNLTTENFSTRTIYENEEDNVNNPSHYTQGNIECIEAIQSALTPEEFRGYCKGNALKYIWRERLKGGDESLQKADWYLNYATK